jgi:hypothetical protein
MTKVHDHYITQQTWKSLQKYCGKFTFSMAEREWSRLPPVRLTGR